MLFQRWSRRDAAYFALIGVGELLIFFNNPGHFFMGDTLLWMGWRYRSITEFFRDFIAVDPTLWYRPLAQRTVESLLYPVSGLHPVPYHAVLFLLFFACTVAVFLVTSHITESRRAAWISTLFFATQITHAFTTFDTAFVPEMAFTLFYVGSVIAWVVWLRSANRKAWIASAVLFVGSLLSKETAVALPFTLLVVWLCLRRHPEKPHARLRSLAPHFVILLVYLAFAIGYLHIRAIDIRQFLEHPAAVGQAGGYQLVLGMNVLDSTKLAFSWAFGIPRGINGQWAFHAAWMQAVLKFVRILILVAALFALFTSRWKFLAIGVFWFLITLGPTLPLLNHFLPYYLFAPLVGFSIAVGAALDGAYEWCAKSAPAVAFAVAAVWVILVSGIDADAANRVAREHFLLGGSAENARNGMEDLRALHPSLPQASTLLIFDEEGQSLAWDQAHGMLYQMAYRNDSIKTEYFTEGTSVKAEDIESGRAIALKWSGGHLADFTSFVKQRPELLLPHMPDEHYHLDLSRAGIIKIPELHDVTLNVLRAYNGVVEEPFQLRLDHHGEGELQAESPARPGTYTFVAMQRVGEPNWVTVSGSVVVR